VLARSKLENQVEVNGCYKAAAIFAVITAGLHTNSFPRASVNQIGPITRDANAHADRAMAWLQKAVAAGYSNAAQLAQDKDFDALRGREDFQKLHAALEPTQRTAPR
jgi:hypothetical protein